MTAPANREPLEKINEEWKALDRKIQRLNDTWPPADTHRRFDLYRALDKLLAELEVAGHWVDSAQGTIDKIIQALKKPP